MEMLNQISLTWIHYPRSEILAVTAGGLSHAQLRHYAVQSGFHDFQDGEGEPILIAVGSTTPNNTATGYAGTDANMDGTVKYTGSSNDRDPILINVGSTTPNNVRVEQLP